MKVQFGAIIVDGRNKIGGHVLSKNRSGAYMRTKVTPVNPQSPAQQQQRQLIGNISSSWRTLTEAQRDSFTSAAPNFPQPDIFGNPRIPSGISLYTSLNTNLSTIGASLISVAPVPEAIPPLALNSLTAVETTAALSLAFTTDVSFFSGLLKLYATPNIGPGRSFVKNRYRFIGTVNPATSPANILTLWQAVFGTLVAGNKIFVKAQLASTNTGQVGVPSLIMAIVS
jgi:hypothetical protein